MLRRYLDNILAQGFIKPSTSPAGAPIMFVPKKEGKLRLYVNYRMLNQITCKDRTLLLLISKILDQLGNAKIYTKLDIREVYYRIRIGIGNK